jgi:hypothetical protein
MEVSVKIISCLALLFSLLSFHVHAQDNKTSAVINSYRTWVKPGHTAALNKALAAHVKQFHSGDWKWRVYDVLTGPDGGALQINEGPHTWTEFEARGDLGEKHMRDYEMNILPHVEKTSPELYAVYRPEYSTTAVSNFSNKALLVHVYPKAGQMHALLTSLKEFKPTWEKLGYNIVVYTSQHSGERSVILVQRLKNGFKDFEPDGSTMRDTYDSINGAGSYDKRMEDHLRIVDRMVMELISYRPEFTAK